MLGTKGGIAVRTVLRCCLLRGIPVSAGLFLMLAAVVQRVDLPEGIFPMLAAMPAVFGSYLTGASAGRRMRRGGLRTGAASALLMTGLWYAAACVLAKKLPVPALFGVSLPAGMLGGIRGVNRPAPRRGRRLHRLPALAAAVRFKIEFWRFLRVKRNF